MPPDEDETAIFECGSCGAEVEAPMDDPPEYCPDCGSRNGGNYIEQVNTKRIMPESA